MRLAATYGLRNAVIRPALPLLQAAPRVQHRTINTKPRNERPQPITEHINLRPQANPRAQSIGILGGGITGLTTAWHISRLVPDAKITLYEKTDRLGGWLDSEIVKIDDGEVLFEWGPRSLRPDPAGSGRATILLLLQLQMQQAIIGISKTAPASLNRFVYYDGQLVQMPGPNPNVPPFWNAVRNGYKLLTQPIFEGVLGSLLAEYWVQPRPLNMTDESVGDFIRRRFGKTAADNIGSAFFHGIYAGDLYKLSARTLLPALWHMETRDPEGAGILMEMVDIAFKGQGLMQFKHGRYVDLLEAAADQDNSMSVHLMQVMLNDLSVYTFGRGLGELSTTIHNKLKENSNIELRTGSDVTDLKFDPESKKTTVTTSTTSETQQHDYIVSTLSAGKLSSFMQGSATSRGVTVNSDTTKALEESNKSVNVGVVNLYYSNPNLIPSSYRGFGYLIPRSVSIDQNPERALGVIFSSESSGVRGKQAFEYLPNPEKSHAESMKDMLEKIKEQKENEKQEKDSNHTVVRFMARGDSKVDADVDADPNQSQNKPKDTRDKLQRQLETEIAQLAHAAAEIPVRSGQDTAPGTKLTVMLGGHWWDGWAASDLPTETELIDMAKTLLARHLKIMENPLVAKARINRDAIPQYTVGYRQRMASVHRGLMEQFQGRLKVAGPWWQGGVGVNDCVLSAHLTAFNIREEWDDETGLREYTEREKWLICDRRTQTFTVDTVR